MKKVKIISLMASMVLAMVFIFSCSGSDDPPPPNEPPEPSSSSSSDAFQPPLASSSSSDTTPGSSGSNENSSSSSLVYSCQLSIGCIKTRLEDCLSIGGSVVAVCQEPSSSSSSDDFQPSLSSSSSFDETPGSSSSSSDDFQPSLSSSSSSDEMPSSSSSIDANLYSCQSPIGCIETTIDDCLLIGGSRVAVCQVSSSAAVSSSSSMPSSSSAPDFACNMTATTGMVRNAISPAPTATCYGYAVTTGLLWTPWDRIPTTEGSVSVSVMASSGACSGMTAQCGSITVSTPVFTCNMTATTGTVGNAISPAPTATCNGRTTVNDALTWRANSTSMGFNLPTSGSVSISVSASSGVCNGMTAQCGNITVSPTFECFSLGETVTIVGTAIPAPTVRCNLSDVTTDLAWTPANLTFTTAGSISVSVRGSGACSGMTAQCGNVTVVPPIVACTVSAVSNNSVTCSGQTYKTVVIGTQTWMAENLNYDVAGSKCYGEGTLSDTEVQANCVKYGRLYDYATARGFPSICSNPSTSCYLPERQSPYRGICPSGWHIPSDEEWDELVTFASGSSTAGTKLKAKSGWNNKTDGTSGNGTDEYGFSALPGGRDYSDGSFFGVGNYGYWWSTTSGGGGPNAWYRNMDRENSVIRSLTGMSSTLSVRCLQD